MAKYLSCLLLLTYLKKSNCLTFTQTKAKIIDHPRYHRVAHFYQLNYVQAIVPNHVVRLCSLFFSFRCFIILTQKFRSYFICPENVTLPFFLSKQILNTILNERNSNKYDTYTPKIILYRFRYNSQLIVYICDVKIVVAVVYVVQRKILITHY